MMGEKGLAGLLDAIGNVGFCFIPAIGLVCTVLMMFTGIVSNTEKGQTRAKFIMVLAMCCTAYSAYSLIKIGIAMIVSAVQRTFTLENIGSFVITSPFKLIGGAFNGIKSSSFSSRIGHGSNRRVVSVHTSIESRSRDIQAVTKQGRGFI